MANDSCDESEMETLLATIDQYARDLGEDTAAAVVSMFLEDFAKHLDELRAAIDSGDGGALKRTAHKLKGSCAQMGDRPAVAFCARLEDPSLTDRDTLAEWEKLCQRYRAVAAALNRQC